jgi:predicted transcriptional regulator
MAKHLAIFLKQSSVEKILSNEKTMEARFSLEKVLPYGVIKKGDEIFLKESGGLILGKVTVDNVLFYEGLEPETVGKIRREYHQELVVDDGFWQKKANAKYVSLIFLKNPRRFITPMKMKKKDRRPWVIWEEE